MTDLNFFFSPSDFSERAKIARKSIPGAGTQTEFVQKLEREPKSCAPEIKIASVKRFDSGNGGLGVLSAIKIAKALDMPLPDSQLDKRVLGFARHLICDLQAASDDFDSVLDAAMFTVLSRRKGKGWAPLVSPKDFLGILFEPDNTSPPVRISIESSPPFKRLLKSGGGERVSDPSKIDASGIMPVDLVAIFGELTRLAFNLNGKKSKFDRRPAAVWRHVLNARTENVGMIRLCDEIERFEAFRDQSQIKDSRFKIDFSRVIIAAFLNYYNLSIEIYRLKEEGNDIPDNLGVCLNSYIKLLRLSEDPIQEHEFSTNLA